MGNAATIIMYHIHRTVYVLRAAQCVSHSLSLSLSFALMYYLDWSSTSHVAYLQCCDSATVEIICNWIWWLHRRENTQQWARSDMYIPKYPTTYIYMLDRAVHSWSIDDAKTGATKHCRDVQKKIMLKRTLNNNAMVGDYTLMFDMEYKCFSDVLQRETRSIWYHSYITTI